MRFAELFCLTDKTEKTRLRTDQTGMEQIIKLNDKEEAIPAYLKKRPDST